MNCKYCNRYLNIPEKEAEICFTCLLRDYKNIRNKFEQIKRVAERLEKELKETEAKRNL